MRDETNKGKEEIMRDLFGEPILRTSYLLAARPPPSLPLVDFERDSKMREYCRPCILYQDWSASTTTALF